MLSSSSHFRAFRPLLLLLLVLGFSFTPSFYALADENDALFAEIKKSQTEREQLYSNGHFVWQVTDSEGAEVTKMRHEYWAKEGRFFRLDSYALVDGRCGGKVRRVISTPTATTLVAADSPSDSGVVVTSTSSDICKDGVCTPSVENITGQFFVSHGNRYATLQVKDLIKRWREKSYDLIQLDVKQNDENACVIEFVRKKLDGQEIGKIVMEPSAHRVRSWTYKYKSKTGQFRAEQHSVIVYGGRDEDIPTGEHSLASSDSEPINGTDTKLVEFDLLPADLNVFSLPTQVSPMRDARKEDVPKSIPMPRIPGNG